MAENLTKAPMPYQPGYGLFGILNPEGQFWSHQTFRTPEEARRYVANFWKGRDAAELDKFKIVPVRVTLEFDATRRAQEEA
jgi:hypothetical protein